jgi:hypothetical protein
MQLKDYFQLETHQRNARQREAYVTAAEAKIDTSSLLRSWVSFLLNQGDLALLGV